MSTKRVDERGPQHETTPFEQPDRGADSDVLNTRLLFRGRKEIQIRHGDEVYRLRITSNGKLILNK